MAYGNFAENMENKRELSKTVEQWDKILCNIYKLLVLYLVGGLFREGVAVFGKICENVVRVFSPEEGVWMLALGMAITIILTYWTLAFSVFIFKHGPSIAVIKVSESIKGIDLQLAMKTDNQNNKLSNDNEK